MSLEAKRESYLRILRTTEDLTMGWNQLTSEWAESRRLHILSYHSFITSISALTLTIEILTQMIDKENPLESSEISAALIIGWYRGNQLFTQQSQPDNPSIPIPELSA